MFTGAQFSPIRKILVVLEMFLVSQIQSHSYAAEPIEALCLGYSGISQVSLGASVSGSGFYPMA